MAERPDWRDAPAWIVFYDDGSSYSSRDGPPELARRDGVQVIVVTSVGTGCHCLAEQNFYCWEFDQWVPHDRDGLEQYLDRPGIEKIRLRGYWVPRSVYSKIRAGAMRDPRLPRATAVAPRQPEGE